MTVYPPIRMAAAGLDLSHRVFNNTTIVASPSGSAETTICSLLIPNAVVVTTAIYVVGWAAYTVGTSGVSVNLKLRQTNTSGTTLAATGATTASAGNLGALSVWGTDTASALPGQVYVLTMTVASGAAASTVSAVSVTAFVI